MSDQNQSDQHGFPANGFSLGGAAADGFDTSLEQTPPPPPSLRLPRGALVMLVKSGGLRFTSRHCVVYRSGYVERGSLTGMARPTYLNAAEIDRLRHLVLRARLGYWAGLRAPLPRDGYSYELAAHYRHRLRVAVFADGNIPVDVARLIRTLQRLM